jgi:hypothetical protein
MRGALVVVLAFLLGSIGWSAAQARRPTATAPGSPGHSPLVDGTIAFLRDARRDASRSGPSAEAPGRFILRRRAVEPDLAALRRAAAGPGRRIRFDLFPDAAATGRIERLERRAGAGLSLSGRLEEPAGDFVLAVERAQVSGSLRLDDGRLFVLAAAANGGAMVEEVDPGTLPECAGAVLPPATEPGPRSVPPAGAFPLPSVPDTGDQIDVLVAYTPRTETAVGGPAAVQALAQRAVDESNRAYVRSGIATRLRLVWRGRVEYDESLDDFQTHLSRLRTPDDGFLDDVIDRRDAAGADVVSLLVDESDAAGVGYLMSQQSIAFEPLALSVVYWFAAANNLSLAHEIGHNQGCEHDREHATGRPVFNDAYGWKFIGNDGRQYRTVMGYLPGQRIANFSNPSVLVQGQPTGRANKENNAHAIGATAATVANFRPHRVHPGSVRDFDGSGTDDVIVFDPDSGGLWVGLARGDGSGAGTSPAGALDLFSWGALPVPAAWGAQAEGDFDGDGWKDLASFDAGASAWWVSRSRGDRFDSLPWGAFPPSAAWRLQTMADFNGDGRDDVTAFDGASGSWSVGVSNGSAFTSVSWGSLAAPFGAWSRAVAGDFNGDGRDDLAVIDETTSTLRVGLSNGAAFAFSSWGSDAGAPPGWGSAVRGDFNGDGRDDLARILPADGTIRVGLSTGSGFTFTTWTTLSGGNWGPLLAGDFDGDGLVDIACFSGLDATDQVGISNGSTFTAAPWGALPSGGEWTRHLSGDFDGDGRMDVAHYLLTTGEWWVGVSRGDRFDLSVWKRFVLPRAGVDTDGDGVDDASDCDATGAGAWALPGEVDNLTLAPAGGPGGATRLAWPEPDFKGGTAVQYDVLRSDSPWYFDWGSLVCLETNDAADREAFDASSPAPGAAWFYLVRAGNACGEGALGASSTGTPRSALTCP